jgi:hypothetical protein
MSWAGHVALNGEMRNAYKILVGKPKGRDNLEDPGVDSNVISEWILWK